MVLESPKLVRSLIMVVTTSVPNLIFLCSIHRAAIDSHWGRRRRRRIHTNAIGATSLINISIRSGYFTYILVLIDKHRMTVIITAGL